MPRVIALDQLQQFTAINLLVDPGAIGGPKVIPSIAEIVMFWSLAGNRTAHIVLHGRYSGPFAGSVAQANAMLSGFTSAANATALFSHFPPTTIFQGVGIRDIGIANQGQIVSTGLALSGTGTPPALPDEVALVITKHTSQTGRANRGRMYVPGWAVAAVAADNTVIPAAVNDLQAWANTIQGTMSASGYTLVIAQPARNAYIGSTGTSHPARPAGATTVSSLFVRDNHWDSQRRRGLK